MRDLGGAASACVAMGHLTASIKKHRVFVGRCSDMSHPPAGTDRASEVPYSFDLTVEGRGAVRGEVSARGEFHPSRWFSGEWVSETRVKMLAIW